MFIQFKTHKNFSLKPIVVAILLFVSGIFISATPLPLVYAYLRKGRLNFYKTALSALGVITLAYGVVLNFDIEAYISLPFLEFKNSLPALTLLLMGVFHFVYYILMSLAIVHIFKVLSERKSKVIDGVFLLYMFITIIFVGMVLPQSGSFFEPYTNEIRSLAQKATQEISQSPSIDREMAMYAQATLSFFAESFFKLLPILIFTSSIFVLVVNLAISKRIFFPFQPEMLFFRITHLILPFYLVWIVCACLGLALLSTQILHIDSLTFVSINVLFGALSLYFYQGLAVLICFLDAKKIHGLWRLAIYILLLNFSFFVICILTLMGFVESWLDVRQKMGIKKI